MEPTNQGNPYAAPESELDVAPKVMSASASLENAVAGRYDFAIGEVMSEAWQLTKGFKGSFWAAAIVIFLIQIVIQSIGGHFIKPSGMAAASIFNGLVGVLMTPLTVGLQMMCIRRALGQPYSFSTAFEYAPKAANLIIASLLVMVLMFVGLALLVLPGIYLAFGYMLTSPLVAAQNLPPWQAMETSRRAITHKWFRVFGLVLVTALITGVSAIALLIPLFWTLPFFMLTTAVLYKRIFHAAPAASAVSPAGAAPGAA